MVTGKEPWKLFGPCFSSIGWNIYRTPICLPSNIGVSCQHFPSTCFFHDFRTQELGISPRRWRFKHQKWGWGWWTQAFYGDMMGIAWSCNEDYITIQRTLAGGMEIIRIVKLVLLTTISDSTGIFSNCHDSTSKMGMEPTISWRCTVDMSRRQWDHITSNMILIWICTRLGDLSLGYGQVDIGKISRS